MKVRVAGLTVVAALCALYSLAGASSLFSDTQTISFTLNAAPSFGEHETATPETASPTGIAELTHTPSPTNTPVIGEKTEIPEETESPKSTHTPRPTHTPTNTPAPTNTPTATPTYTPTPAATATSTVVRRETEEPEPTKTKEPKTPKPTHTPAPTPTPWIPGYNNCGDVTGDGLVTVHDVNIEALMLWLGMRAARYDVNRDGKLNYWDLLLIINQLGTECRR